MRKLRVKTKNKSTMKCREAEMLIIDFVAQSQFAQMQTGLSEHLVSCSSCTRLLKEYGSGFNALASGRRTTPDPGFYGKMMIKMQSQDDVQPESKGLLSRIINLSPAVLAVAASVILGIWLGGRLFAVTESGTGTGYNLSGEERTGLVAEFAGDIHLNDEMTLSLEDYLINDENPVNHDIK